MGERQGRQASTRRGVGAEAVKWQGVAVGTEGGTRLSGGGE